MDRFGFAPAQPGDLIYGAQRPGYSSHAVQKTEVDDWISFMKARGIRRVCCLLATRQLAYYDPDLLEQYREAFGASRVLSAPVEDYHPCDPVLLEKTILPFLANADRAHEPTVVHCSAGSGRTGQILAAWLVRRRGLTVEDALGEVRKACREPREAIGPDCTDEHLHALLRGPCEEPE